MSQSGGGGTGGGERGGGDGGGEGGGGEGGGEGGGGDGGGEGGMRSGAGGLLEASAAAPTANPTPKPHPSEATAATESHTNNMPRAGEARAGEARAGWIESSRGASLGCMSAEASGGPSRFSSRRHRRGTSRVEAVKVKSSQVKSITKYFP